MHNNQESHNMPKKMRFPDVIGKHYGEIDYSGGKVLQSRHGSVGSWNFMVTFAYFVKRIVILVYGCITQAMQLLSLFGNQVFNLLCAYPTIRD